MNDIFLILILILSNLALFFFLYWKPRQKRKQQEEGLYFESSQGPIFYQIHGKQKDTILLLHGLGASSYCWRKLIPLLENDFTLINCDLWGFGKSSKENHQSINLDQQMNVLIELLDELKVDQLYIAGNSMGAQIGFWMAKCFESRVKKVVALSPATYPKLVPLYISKARWISNWTPHIISHNLVRSAIINTLGNPHNISSEMVDAYLEPYLDPKSHQCFAGALHIIEDTRVYNSLQGIHTPTLLLWGERDKVIQRHIIEDIAAKMPSVILQTHPKSGHCPMEEHPKWCAEQIIPFLKS